MMFSIREKIYRAIIALIGKEDKITLTELSKLTLISSEIIRNYLSTDFIEIVDDKIIVRDKIALAYDMINSGIPVEEVLFNLGWRDVERFCAEYFEKLQYKVTRNFRFKRSLEHYEIDIIAYKHPYVLSIDCKRLRRINEYILEQAAIKQLVRTVALSYEIWRYSKALGIKREKVKIIPLVILASLSKPRIYSGVPVISVRDLPFFLREFENYLEERGGTIKCIESSPPLGL